MLNSETKRRIDSCRDILVGKIPNPMGQIEQITNSLVYKFMDDQDRKSVEFGGKRSFFVDEYEPFAWSKLMDSKLSNQDRANLYVQGLEKLSTAKHLPELFRDIFKNAFLPFRDPSTISLFLNEINGFDYHHSEELGNAFEYLLAIMGSQGDAGQFRTPRHVIEFLVDVVDPDKHETIHDPACGTAGFLVEAFNHIREKGLTVADQAELSNKISGVDIDPGMAKIARVNLYLHGFKTPNIQENDTLSNEALWDAKYDVILANPPFMSPKGGIQPHDKFGVRSTRSEVLFVDYIAEHLKLKGRAGIIVPEGVIFQSAGAYKDLRKMLVKTGGLWAVVSLPGGVFNPYSGVKTSILFLDREIAGKSDGKILFAKVSNDGYDLGAQRRPINKNDLPEVLEILRNRRKQLATGVNFEIEKPELAHLVEVSKIEDSTDWNLSGERYRTSKIVENGQWEMVELGDICNLEYGKALPTSSRVDGPYPVMGSNGRSGFHNEFLVSGPVIIIGRKGSAGEVTWESENCFPIDTTYYVKLKTDKANYRYLYSILKNLDLGRFKGGAGIPGLNRNDVYGIKIPLPPLEVQEQIVAELDGYQKIIDGARQVVENYKPTFRIDPEWEMVELGKICSILNGFAFDSKYFNKQKDGIPLIRIRDVNSGFSETYYSGEFENKYLIDNGDFLIGMDGDFKAGIWNNGVALLNQRVCKLYDFNGVFKEYVFFLVQKELDTIQANTYAVTVKHLSSSQIQKIKIPLPPLKIQEQIVARIEAEQKLVDANKELVAIYEGKMKERIGEVSGQSV